MGGAAELLPAAALAWAAALVGAQGVASLRCLQARRKPWSADRSHGPVLVLRPCAGAESQLAENLRSTARARWQTLPRVRFAVASRSDAAWPVCESVAAELRAQGLDARALCTDVDAPNQKAAQIAAALAAEPDPPAAVLVADSDADLTDLPLGALVARLEASPRRAAVWVPPVERSSLTAGDRASRALLGASLHAFPLLSQIDPDGLVGKLFAARTEALAAVGGFDALVRHLGEDMELARRWRAAGWTVEAAPFVVPSTASGRSWDAAAARYARWLTVIRAQRPHLLGSYPLLFFGTAPWSVLSLGACALAPHRAPALALAGLCVVAARVTVAWTGARCASAPFAWKDIPRADALLASGFARALRSRTVSWRGRALAVRGDGTLYEVSG